MLGDTDSRHPTTPKIRSGEVGTHTQCVAHSIPIFVVCITLRDFVVQVDGHYLLAAGEFCITIPPLPFAFPVR